MKKVIFPPEVQEFAREIHQHPLLIELINNLEEMDLGNILAATFTYCGIQIDGTYDGTEVTQICHKLVILLKEKRKSIIISDTEGNA